jgi:iron(III) transport system substrate-binding protein
MLKNLVPFALGSLLGLAACGGGAAPAPAQGAPSGAAAAAKAGAPSSPEQLAAYQAADRQQTLETGAKKEGTLTWYTTLAGPIIDSLANGFKAQYPYLKVEIYRADESAILTRAIQEDQAGKPVFDVIEVTPTASLLLSEAKLLAPYYSPTGAKLPDALKSAGPNGLIRSASDRVSYIGFGYNTKLVPADAVPKTMADLMNPALSGKLTLAGTATGYRWLGAVLKNMGDDAGRKWLTDFAAKQKPSVQQISGKAVFDLVAKGELPASPTIFLDHVEQGKAAGQPAEWVPLDPVVGNAGQVSFDAKAPHPNAAMLYIDYLLGDGQEVLKQEHYLPATEKVPFSPWLPEQWLTADQAEKQDKTWSDLFKTDFR